MERKTLWLAAAALFLLIIPSGIAQSSDFGIFEPLGSVFSPIFNLFIQGGALEGQDLLGFTRFIIWIAVFAVVFMGLKTASGEKGWIKDNIAIVLALCFSTISAVFMPNQWVLQIGSSWAQAAFLLMVGLILAAVIGGAYALRNSPLMSAALLFIGLALVSYFNEVLGIERPEGNVVAVFADEASTGILHVVFQTAGAVVGIAFLIQLIRGILGLFGGGNLQGGGPNWGGLFRGGQQGQHGDHGNGGGHDGGNGGGGDGGPPAQPLQVHIRGPANGHHVQPNTPVRFVIEVTGGQFNIDVAGHATTGGHWVGIGHHVIHNDQQRAFDMHHTFQNPGNYVVEFVAEDAQHNTHAASIVIIVGQAGHFALNIVHPTAGQTFPANQPIPFEGNVVGGTFPIQWGIRIVNRQNDQEVHVHNGVIHNNAQRNFTHNHALPAGHYRAAFLVHEHKGKKTGDQVDFEVVQGPVTQQLAIHIVHPTQGHAYQINQDVPFEATLNHGNLPITWVLNIVDRNTNQPVLQPHHVQGQRHFTHHQQLPAGNYRAVFLAHENGDRGTNAVVEFDVGGGQQFAIDVHAPQNNQHIPAGQQFAMHAEIIGGVRPVRWVIRDMTTHTILAPQSNWINQQGNIPVGPVNSPPNLAPGQHVIRFEAEDHAHHIIHTDRTIIIGGGGGGGGHQGQNVFEVRVGTRSLNTGQFNGLNLRRNGHSEFFIRNIGRSHVRYRITDLNNMTPGPRVHILDLAPNARTGRIAPNQEIRYVVTVNPNAPVNIRHAGLVIEGIRGRNVSRVGLGYRIT